MCLCMISLTYTLCDFPISVSYMITNQQSRDGANFCSAATQLRFDSLCFEVLAQCKLFDQTPTIETGVLD